MAVGVAVEEAQIMVSDGGRLRYRVGSVDHALTILLLLQRQPELRVTDTARELGVAASTAHRLITTLTARGFLTQDRVTKAYRAGPALIELGVRSTSSRPQSSGRAPHQGAGRAVGETVNLLVLEGGSVRFIAGFEADQRVRTHVLTGTLLPAYAVSGGKILLAEMSREALRELYPRGLRQLTPRTRTFTPAGRRVVDRDDARVRGESGRERTGPERRCRPAQRPSRANDRGRRDVRTQLATSASADPRNRHRAPGCAASIRGDLYRGPV